MMKTILATVVVLFALAAPASACMKWPPNLPPTTQHTHDDGEWKQGPGSPVPEPSGIVLVGTGLVVFGSVLRKKRIQK